MEHTTHADHRHDHGAPDCALHDGHLHHVHEGHIDEHKLDVNATSPAACTSAHACEGHASNHAHGASCGHEPVPHGDHTNYLVAGQLHNRSPVDARRTSPVKGYVVVV